MMSLARLVSLRKQGIRCVAKSTGVALSNRASEFSPPPAAAPVSLVLLALGAAAVTQTETSESERDSRDTDPPKKKGFISSIFGSSAESASKSAPKDTPNHENDIGQTMEDAARKFKEEIDKRMFDATSQWNEDSKKGSDFLQSLFADDTEPEVNNEPEPKSAWALFGSSKRDSDTSKDYRDFSKDFLGFLSGKNDKSTVVDMAAKARAIMQDDVSSSSTLTEAIQAGSIALNKLDQTMKNFFGEDGPPKVNPPNIHYWIEHEEERKNPGWKRRKHRFCPHLDISKVEELDRKLHFAQLCYADTLEEIKKELENSFDYELLYCNMESQANRPSHFVAIKRKQPIWSDHLEVTLVVRGTKTIMDVITDILCEETEYRGGLAHAGMLESGRYLSEKHKPFFRQLCDLSKKSRIKLTIIGHSLGAGAASIAGMELNDEDFIDVEVYGFGAPATLSKDLSESAKPYITTIIADNDCVPRMSTATMINTVVNISEYDWVASGMRDIGDAISAIQGSVPFWLRFDKEKAMKTIEGLLLRAVVTPEPTTKRMIPSLFPPGECVHFYRDGLGISAVTVPCTFFSELDMNWRMVDDHLYHTGYKLIFLDMMRQHYRDHHFSFETDQIEKKAKEVK